MSISGIYALNFNSGTSIYVGQSQDIHKRINRHIHEIQVQKHYNYRVQEAYNKYGLPECIILEICECDKKILDNKENFWIDEFDCCRNGLNLRDKDESVLRGPNANSAIYSKEQITKVFEMLLDINNTPKYIQSITGVPIGSINCIARSASHLWLKSDFPEKYSILESLVGKRKGLQNTLGSKGRVWPTLVSPSSVQYSDITNLKQFCKDNNLPYDQIHRLCTNKARSVHGWTLSK